MWHYDYMIIMYRDKVNAILYKNGYSHRLKCHKNGRRYQFWLNDESAGGEYHTKEYGNFTARSAFIFIEAFYNGLNLGTLDNPI